jgi:uncharacterized cupredoxin-like copper-binding protein
LRRSRTRFAFARAFDVEEIMLQKIAFALVAMFVFAVESIADNSRDSHGGKHPLKGRAEMKRTDFGHTGDPRKVTRTIPVDTSDTMRFTPGAITVKRGETVRFVVTNSGKQMHEMVLGTMAELKGHAALMRKHPEMEHDEPYMAHVASGKKAEIIWQFTKAGEFHYGCLVPGHFEAGMIGKIVVRP